MSTIILFCILFGLLAIGMPIAFALGVSSLLGIVLLLSPAQLPQIINIIYSEGTNGTLLVAPLFILMAEILIVSGISRDLFDCVNKWFSRIPGSLAVTSILSAAGFSSVTGSSPATVATIGGISAPEMMNRNYSKKLSSGAIVTGGTLGILIPPSLAMIIYGIITETSIVKLFIAGIIPGILLTILLSLVVILYALIRPESLPKGEKYTWKERFSSLIQILPVAILAFVIIYSMYSGLAGATEAAGVGVVVALLISFVMKRMTWEGFTQALVRSAKTSSMILFLIIGGMLFSFVVAYLGVASMLIDLITSLGLGPWTALAILMLVLIFLGMFLDPISMLTLTMPFMFPLVVDLGFDPIWFGVMVAIAAEIGMITPPIGLNLFVLKGAVPELDLEEDIVKGALPFVLVLLSALVLLALFPQLVSVLL